MSTRKSFLSGTSALVAIQNEKTKSLPIRREVKIVNELGLHARPAAEFVLAAKAFRSQIWLIKGGERFSAASILDVLCANLNCGDTATIEAEGPDARGRLSD